MKKDFSLTKFRSDLDMISDRDYIVFDDKTYMLFVEMFFELILNSKEFDTETKNFVKQIKNEKEFFSKENLKKIENYLMAKIWGTSGDLSKNQYASLLVIFSCISDHWKIFPKIKK